MEIGSRPQSEKARWLRAGLQGSWAPRLLGPVQARAAEMGTVAMTSPELNRPERREQGPVSNSS